LKTFSYELSWTAAAASSVRQGCGGSGFTDRFPTIGRACENLPPETLIDVEVFVVDDNGPAASSTNAHLFKI